MTKQCRQCGEIKPIDQFYVHKAMKDGHLNKCKNCVKSRVSNKHTLDKADPNYVEKQRKRGRDKYYRLGYSKRTPHKEVRKLAMDNYKKNYPEKQRAKVFCSNLKKVDGFHFHHWSYNENHYVDVILLTPKHHAKAHRFIVYDQERMMYRRSDNNELLDAKEKHLEWITFCIENKED